MARTRTCRFISNQIVERDRVVIHPMTVTLAPPVAYGYENLGTTTQSNLQWWWAHPVTTTGSSPTSWVKERLPVAIPAASGLSLPRYGGLWRMNDRLEMILNLQRTLSDSSTMPVPALVRNGRLLTFDNYVPAGWTVNYATDINSTGTILASATAPATSAYPNPTSEPVLLVPIRVKLVSFDATATNFNRMFSDDLTTSNTGPQWVDSNDDGRMSPGDPASGDWNLPVSYIRNTKPKIGVVFEIPFASALGQIKIRAHGSDGIEIPATVAVVGSSGSVSIDYVESSGAFPNHIKYYDKNTANKAFTLDWEMQIADSGWFKVATTQHTIYVTLGQPKGWDIANQAFTTNAAMREETLYWLGCKAADGETTEEGARTKIYAEFTDQYVSRRDGTVMTYWGGGNQGGISAGELLWRPDANGNCQAWAGFFRDMLLVQGITANRVRVWVSSDSVATIENTLDSYLINAGNPPAWHLTLPRVAVKNWHFEGSASGGQFPYIYYSEYSNPATAWPLWERLPAQNNPHPKPAFNGHWITESGGILYDPSYGTPPVQGPSSEARNKAFEDAAFDGYLGSYTIVNSTHISFIGIKINNTNTSSSSDVSITNDNN